MQQEKIDLSDLNIKIFNRSVLLDVRHVAIAGQEKFMGGIVVGRHEISEVPTYGIVVAYDPTLSVDIGDIISIPTPGVLRAVDWPGKPKDLRVVSMRMDNIDVLVKETTKE